jgi:serine/threonine-protein kinase
VLVRGRRILAVRGGMKLRARQRLGQYRIEGHLSSGGFASVYRAYDTIEGVRVALKIPQPEGSSKSDLDAFRREVRLHSRLDHPNILGVKTAFMHEGRLVIVTPLGLESLADRMTRRMARTTALEFSLQIAAALAYSHKHGVVHLDVKPDNLILFREGRLRLGDFGIARMTRRTLDASGSGTLGFVAPEQALGRPSARSDVFSAGLILWRLAGGALPRWPFEWPHPGIERVERGWSPQWIAILRKATQVNDRKRQANGSVLHQALERAAPRALLS